MISSLSQQLHGLCLVVCYFITSFEMTDVFYSSEKMVLDYLFVEPFTFLQLQYSICILIIFTLNNVMTNLDFDTFGIFS